MSARTLWILIVMFAILCMIVSMHGLKNPQKQGLSTRQETAVDINSSDAKLAGMRQELSSSRVKYSMEMNRLNFKIAELERTIRRLEKRIEALENPKPRFMPLGR